MSLVRNPTFLFLNLAGASEGLIISGFAVFLPKQIENQYSVTAVWAALLMGKFCFATFEISWNHSNFSWRPHHGASRRWWNVLRRLPCQKTQAVLLGYHKILHDCINVRRSLHHLLLLVLPKSQFRRSDIILPDNRLRRKQGDNWRRKLWAVHTASDWP